MKRGIIICKIMTKNGYPFVFNIFSNFFENAIPVPTGIMPPVIPLV
jgi:hypothetical protein